MDEGASALTEIMKTGRTCRIVNRVEVRVVPQGRGYRLDPYNEGVFIGEYE
jgi:hypothetical protein